MAFLGSTSLTGCSNIPDFLSPGSLMLFKQSSAPTSWVKETTHNDKMLRVVSGTASPGGTNSFNSTFPSTNVPITGSATYTGVVGDTTLSTTQIPAHQHTQGNVPLSGWLSTTPQLQRGRMRDTTSTGGGGAHSHPFTGAANMSTSLNLNLKYVDVIICSKS